MDDLALTIKMIPAVPVQVPIMKSPAVDSVLANVALRFSGGAAGEPTAIVLSFRPDINLEQGEVVTLTLPRFTRSGTCFLQASVPDNLFGLVEWVASKQEVVFALAVDVPAGQDIKVILPVSAGFKLPLDGVTGEHQFTLSTDAARVPMCGFPILDFNKIGKITDASLTYSACCLQTITFTSAGAIFFDGTTWMPACLLKPLLLHVTF